jgi:F-type H+-transporting ATPase subunit delta
MARRSSSGARNVARAFLQPVGEAALSPPAAAVTAAGEALDAPKALAPALEAIPGRAAGRGDAARLERMLRDTVREAAGAPWGSAAAVEDTTAGLERAIRLAALLVRKNLRHLIVPVIREGERIIDAMRGTLEVRLESAGPMDGDILDALKQRLVAKTGAKQIRIVPVDAPELLGGCRLVIGTEAFDASLRGQIARMAADLRAAVPAGGM